MLCLRLILTMKVAPRALPIPLALRETVGVRETVIAAATYVLRGGAAAMTVCGIGQNLLELDDDEPGTYYA